MCSTTMCETMANIPAEGNPSYVLTEDMIDAAMNEQFSYQDDIESEEELSSLEENVEMEVVQDAADDSPSTIDAENTNIPVATQSDERIILNRETAGFNGSSMSVLVIETGLDRTKSNSARKEDDPLAKVSSKQDGNDTLFKSNSCSNSSSGVTTGHKQTEVDEINNSSQGCNSNEKRLPILKKILSNKPLGGENGDIESIDLCDSDTDEFSESDMAGVESIDDELKSVMESNLMAEVGMTINKPKDSDRTPEPNPPKIAVKSISQISSNFFNNMPQNLDPISIGQSTQNINLTSISKNEINKRFHEIAKKSVATNISNKARDQATGAIHINKIAVPHQTFVNSQGKTLQCVYVKNSPSMPVVITTSQTTTNNNNKNVKYVMTSQVKKVKAISPIAALTNMTKQKSIQPKPTKVLAVAQKLEKPSTLQNFSQIPHQFNLDLTVSSVINSLIFHDLMKPYVPSDVKPFMVTYGCKDCSDRFILRSSLSQHLSRRTILINFWCRVCKAELQFYNRCTLLKHMRSHGNLVKHFDTSCVSFSPLSKEIIDNGVVSTYLTAPSENLSPLNGEKAVEKLDKDGSENKDSPEKDTGSPATHVLNGSTQTTTTVSGQSKSIQNKNSVLLNKLVSKTVISSSSSKFLPILIPNSPKVSVIQAVPKQTKDHPSGGKNPVPKNVVLLRNKVPSNNKQNTQINRPIEPEPRKIDTEILIDDDFDEKMNEKAEEEDIDVENVIVENNSPSDNTSVVSPKENGESPTNKRKGKKTSSPSSKSVRRFCSECGTSCLNISKHLTGTNRPTNPHLMCSVCHLIMPTKCSLRIHLRVHMKLAPYRCPDCGKEFVSFNELNAHLQFSCGHLAKCVRFMCTTCKEHFPTIGGLSHHISTEHSRDIFKCNLCPVAFFVKDSLTKHTVTIHPNETLLGMDYKQCSLCPKKLVPTDRFLSHVQEHTRSSSSKIYGFKCPMCFAVFANKMAFIIHQIKEKKGEKEDKDVRKNNKNKTLNSSLSHLNARSGYNEQSSVQASDSNSDFEEEPEIIRKYPDTSDELSMTEKDPLSLDGFDYNQVQSVNERIEELCIVCKKNYVILLPGIDLNSQSLCCKQCVKPLDVDSALSGHKVLVIDKPQMRIYRQPDTSPENSKLNQNRSTLNNAYRSSSCDEIQIVQKKRRASDVSLSNGSSNGERYIDADIMPPKKKSRKKQKELMDPTGRMHIQGQVISTETAADVLTCAKCDYITENREAFLEHITIHRSDPNTFQCLECGLCFVVLPSLERHLIHHRIKDVNDYIAKNKSCAPQTVVVVEEETDDNQCRVCRETFDCLPSLEKHFRTHGMAFMNSLSKSP